MPSLFCHACCAAAAVPSKSHPGTSAARLPAAPASSTAEMPVLIISSSPSFILKSRMHAMFLPSALSPAATAPALSIVTEAGAFEKFEEKNRYCFSAHPAEMRLPLRTVPSHASRQSTGRSQLTAKPRSASTCMVPPVTAVYLCKPHRGVAVSSALTPGARATA